jgi:hypothetical protein
MGPACWSIFSVARTGVAALCPGDWYFRFGLFDNYDSQPPEGFSNNDYGWSNAFGFKF